MDHGSKRFTKNDLSWLLPNSKSHQSGINLPLAEFESLFPEIVRMEGAPRLAFRVSWFDKDGEEFAQTENDVVWYNSKNELRILQIRSVGLTERAGVGDILRISRNGRFLRAWILKPQRFLPR
tara:strand:- start:114 stop:482 length:369 start_codon:yes stop_codon:yes gene_type:complete